MGGCFRVGLDPNTPPPPPLDPPTQTNVWQWGITNLGSNGARTIFLRFVRGLENWFHPMCLIPKCSNLNAAFKSFIFPHNLGLGLCSHIDFSPLWRPQEGRGYLAILISPPWRP